MTKKTRGAGGDNREQLPEGSTSELTELRTLFMEAQTATQTSIQQLGEILAARLDALTLVLESECSGKNFRFSMTKKTRGAGGDNREQLPEGSISELTELRTLFMEAQTATQTSIQQLGEMLAARLDALTCDEKTLNVPVS
ncbi:hypothetical protein F2Q68_00014656 [Brassica cretica]|uniref:Uncharacterized protein n=1 Tax=Brassica cretica TaxID=69181 RepID=A0A8S9HBA9_BRACR|nr:hypothetical protein F2Q68_00014656 [Brassica cretica]